MARPLLVPLHGSGHFRIRRDGHYELAAKDEGGIRLERRSGWNDIECPDRCLALIAVQGPHITLQSRCESCIIVPPELDPGLLSEARGKISLDRSTLDYQYNVVLRPHDCVYLGLDEDSCTCSFKVLLDDIQVASSIPDTQGQRAAIDEKPQQTHSQVGKNFRASPKTFGSPEEASNIQKESTERRTHEQIPAATPVAGSTGTSQIVKDTPATDRLQDISLQKGRSIPLNRPGLGSYGMEDASRWKGNGSALSHSESMTVNPRSLSMDGPEENEDDATGSEGSDEEYEEDDLDAVKSPKPDLESSHANSTSKLRSASHQQAEKKGGPQDSYDEEDAQRNKIQMPRRPLPSPDQRPHSPRVLIPAPPLGLKRKASEEELTLSAKRSSRVEESEDIWNSSSKSPAGYGRRAKAKLRSAKAPGEESKTPQSSNRSSRSSVDEGPVVSKDTPIRVVFSNSNVVTRPSPMKFLEKRGVRVLNNVSSNDFDFLCVKSQGSMMKSFKLLMSVISGKRIISEDWVTESHKAQKLLDTNDFIVTNAPDEWGWGNSQDEVVEALDLDRSKLFKGFEVVITPHLKKEYGQGYKDVEKLLEATGASKVSSKGARTQGFNDDTIVIGSENGDPDASKLAVSGAPCFSKDFISMSILRGQELDLESEEFKLHSNTPKKTGKVGRPKKSR